MTDRTTAAAERPDPHVIVLFGVTGDLARRKLLPGLFHLHRAQLLPERFRIVGTSPDEWTEPRFIEHVHSSLQQFGDDDLNDDSWPTFAQALCYVRSSGSDFTELVRAVGEERAALGGATHLLHYLSIPPSAFESVVEMLGSTGLSAEPSRVVLEKPFGHDVASARALNACLHEVFDEQQIFRIDHFLGKEDVQNILVARFANEFFEPMWCNRHIDNVQIDVPETLGLEGRAGFYEGTGAFRDMVVTHLFQVMGFVAMGPPDTFSAHELGRRKLEVFEAMRPLDPKEVVHGQYVGYRSEPGVAEHSDTETMSAVVVHVDNDRWSGVPFFLRTGKKMKADRRIVALTLKTPHHWLFPGDHAANTVTFDLEEPGVITVTFLAKEPGASMELGTATMRFDYASSFDVSHELEAYERLLHDVMTGDRTLFTQARGIERLWEVADPILRNPPPVQPYQPGSWGPASVDELVAPRRWQLSATQK